MEHTASEMMKQAEKSEGNAREAVINGERVVDQAASDVSAVAARSEEEVESQKRAFKDFEEHSGDTLESVDRTSAVKDNGEDNDVTEYAEGTDAQAAAILNTMNQQIGDTETASDAEDEKIMDNVTAEAEVIEAGIAAGFSGVDSAIQNAGNLQSAAEENLQISEKELFQATEKLEKHRTRFSEFVDTALDNFGTRVKDEKEELQQNFDYLDKYARFTHMRELQLTRSAIEFLANQASTSDNAYDEVEMQEFEMSQSVNKLLGSTEFQSLAKIMEAGEYVEQVTMDNGEVMKWLDESESSSVKWMRKVLVALGLAHDDMLAEQAAQAAEELASEAKAQEKEGRAIDGLEAEALAGGAALPTDSLKNMTNATLGMVKEEQSTTSVKDQARIDALMFENDQMQGAADGEYKQELDRYEQNRGRVQNISVSVDDMTDRVQKLLDYNAEVVQMERDRIAKVAGALSDEVFSQGLGDGGGGDDDG